MAFKIRLNRNKTRNLRPSLVHVSIVQVRDLADIGYYRPASSIARSGFGVRAVGKHNHHKAHSKFATGTPCRVTQNIKKKH